MIKLTLTISCHENLESEVRSELSRRLAKIMDWTASYDPNFNWSFYAKSTDEVDFTNLEQEKDEDVLTDEEQLRMCTYLQACVEDDAQQDHSDFDTIRWLLGNLTHKGLTEIRYDMANTEI